MQFVFCLFCFVLFYFIFKKETNRVFFPNVEVDSVILFHFFQFFRGFDCFLRCYYGIMVVYSISNKIKKQKNKKTIFTI